MEASRVKSTELDHGDLRNTAKAKYIRTFTRIEDTVGFLNFEYEEVKR